MPVVVYNVLLVICLERLAHFEELFVNLIHLEVREVAELFIALSKLGSAMRYIVIAQ